MSSIHLFFFLSFLFSLCSPLLRGYLIPDKVSFIPLNHGIPTLIELTNITSELYYLFDNQFDSSAIIIYTKNAKQYTTSMYFYDSYESIKIDQNGEYINFIKELDLSEKLNYVNSTKKCNYYIIIKDFGKFKTKDYITIFNEKDILELKEDQPFVIQMFFQNNIYTLSFEGEEDDLIDLDININDKNFNQSIIIMKNNVEIFNEVINKGIIPLNEEK